MLKCSTCKLLKPEDDYYTNKKTRSNGEEYIYTNPRCKECVRAAGSKWRKDNPEKRRLSIQKDNARPEKIALMNSLRKEARDDGSYREWQRNNKGKIKRYRMGRQNKSHDIKREDWNYCKRYFDSKCAYCDLPIRNHMNVFKEYLIWTDFHKEHVAHDGANDLQIVSLVVNHVIQVSELMN